VGYICTSYQNTRTVDGLAYELGVGMRYDFSYNLVVDGSYKMRWWISKRHRVAVLRRISAEPRLEILTRDHLARSHLSPNADTGCTTGLLRCT